MKIKLPTKKGQPNTNPEIEFKQLVVVGANGSGKTRFGSKIEQTYLGQTHRVSAQKSLSFPKEVSPKSKKRAEIEFYYGYYYESYNDQQHLQSKGGNRWGGNFNTYLLNDYEKLLVLLHTEEYEESLNYKEGRREKPITKLDRMQTRTDGKRRHDYDRFQTDKCRTENILNYYYCDKGKEKVFRAMEYTFDYK